MAGWRCGRVTQRQGVEDIRGAPASITGAVLLAGLLAAAGAAVGSLVPWWMPIDRPSEQELRAAVVELHPAPGQIDSPGGLATFSSQVPYGGYQEAEGDPATLLAASRQRASAAGWRTVAMDRSRTVVQRDGMRATLRGTHLEVWPWIPWQLPATVVGALAGLGLAAVLHRRGIRPPGPVKPLMVGLVPIAALVAVDNALSDVPPAPYGDDLLLAALFGWPFVVGAVIIAYLVAGAVVAVHQRHDTGRTGPPHSRSADP